MQTMQQHSLTMQQQHTDNTSSQQQAHAVTVHTLTTHLEELKSRLFGFQHEHTQAHSSDDPPRLEADSADSQHNTQDVIRHSTSSNCPVVTSTNSAAAISGTQDIRTTGTREEEGKFEARTTRALDLLAHAASAPVTNNTNARRSVEPSCATPLKQSVTYQYPPFPTYQGVYVRKHTCSHVHTQAHTHTHVHVHTYTYTHTHTHAHAHSPPHTRTHTFTHVCVCIRDIYTWTTHTHSQSLTHTLTHTHIQIHDTCMCVCVTCQAQKTWMATVSAHSHRTHTMYITNSMHTKSPISRRASSNMHTHKQL